MPESKSLLSKYYRLFLYAAVFAVVVYLIARNINTFGNVLIVVLGFGLMVMVHEFGHFIVAKLSGIKVEAFSIGFPPVLAGILRTENGYRIRILPQFFKNNNKKEDDESEEGGLSFTIPKAGKAGETEYRIGLIPFGGFVKMLGQEDAGVAEASDDPRSFANKPAATRVAVISAGVVFNALSAIIIFMIAFLVGIKLPPAVVGGVVPDSPAAQAGLKAGDEVIEVDGKSENLDFTDILMAAALSDVNQAISLKVKHADDTIEKFAITARQLTREKMRSFGIIFPRSLTIANVAKADADKLFEMTGLRANDQIVAVNDREVQTSWELSEIIQTARVAELTIRTKRKDELIESQIALDLLPLEKQIQTEAELSHIYSMVPRLRITNILPPSESKFQRWLNKLGIRKKTEGQVPALKKGDIILAIGDIENPTYKELRDVTIEHEDKDLPVKILRTDTNGTEETLTVTVVPRLSNGSGEVLIGMTLPAFDAEHPVVANTIAAEGGPVQLAIPRGAVITAVDDVEVSSFYDIIRVINRNPGQRISIDYRLNEQVAGSVVLQVDNTSKFITAKSVFVEDIPFRRLERLYKAGGPIEAISMGYKKTVMLIVQTYATIRSLIGGRIGADNLLGPVGIVTLSYRIVAEQPFIYYVYFLGLISACIAVFNFLPLPPLDGGLIVITFAEKIKGSALSTTAMGVIAYTGWILIGTLVLYVTFNDIVRSFFS